MLRFFKSPQPAALFLIPFITTLLWAKAWGDVPVFEGSMWYPLWKVAAPAFLLLPDFLRLLLMVVVVTGSSIYFNLILNKHEVLYKNSYLPAFLFALFSSSIPSFLSVHPFHFTNLLILFVLDQGYSLYREGRPVATLFNAGLAIGLCLLFAMPLTPFVLFALLQLSILRPFQLREYLVLLIGLFLPAFYLAVVWFPQPLFDNVTWLSGFMRHYRLDLTVAAALSAKVLGGILLVILVASLVRLRRFYFKNIVRMRDYQQVVLVLLLISAGTLFLTGILEPAHFLVLTVPVSVFVTYYFISARKFKWFYETLLWVLAGVVVWNQLASIG